MNDYNERLAYGSDQGRWLMDEVNAPGSMRRRLKPSCYQGVADPLVNADGMKIVEEEQECLEDALFHPRTDTASLECIHDNRLPFVFSILLLLMFLFAVFIVFIHYLGM